MNTTAATTRPQAARLAVSLCFILIGGVIGTWVSRIPAIQEKLGMSEGTLGLVLLSPALGAIVAMPFAGWCVGRFGSRWITWVLGVLLACSLPWLALAQTPLLLAGALFVFGATFGGMDVAVNAQAVEVEQLYGRSIMSSFHALYSAGGILGSAAGGAMAREHVMPWQHFVGATVLLGVPILALSFSRLLPQKVAAVEAIAPAGEGEPRGFRVPPLPLLALGVAAFCVMMAEGSVADWAAIFLKGRLGVGEDAAAMGFAAFSLTMTICRFGGDALLERLGPVLLVRLGGWLAAAGLLLSLLSPALSLALLGFGLVGAGLATIVPIIFSAAGRTPGYAAGPALSVVTTIGYTGFLLGPAIIGFVAEHSSLRGALGIIVFMCVIVGLLGRFARAEEPKPARQP